MNCVRLTKSWRRSMKPDWFRRELFASADWEPSGDEERAMVPFQVTIGDRDLGIQRLEVTYDPSRPANNNAPTTHLIWNATMRRELEEDDYYDWLLRIRRSQDGTLHLSISWPTV